jgi:hypothetical protein
MIGIGQCYFLSNTEYQLSSRDWLMTLHCWRYSGDGWAFETQLPDWATKHSKTPQSPLELEGDNEEEKKNITK